MLEGVEVYGRRGGGVVGGVEVYGGRGGGVWEEFGGLGLVPLNNRYTFSSSMFDTISSGKHTWEWCVRKTEVLACGCLQK